MPGLHARLSPSDWSRWSTCPGAIRLTEHIVKPSSVFAAEGTGMHIIRAECLELGMDPQDFLGHKLKVEGFEFEVNEDWCRWLQPGIDWVREQPGTLFVERRVDLSDWMPGQFGTADADGLRHVRQHHADQLHRKLASRLGQRSCHRLRVPNRQHGRRMDRRR